MTLRSKIFFLIWLAVNCTLSQESCDVVIYGGSLSSLSSAISSSLEGVKTCLIEPTNWVGGQTTSSLVSAIDFAWHTLESNGKIYYVYKNARMHENLPNFLVQLLTQVPDMGKCWVSTNCFLPKVFLENGIYTILKTLYNLTIYYDTVIKSVKKVDSKIVSIETIHRIPKHPEHCGGYDKLLSEDLPLWYNRKEDDRFYKQIIQFSGKVFIESSEFGELLVLSESEYLQGTSEQYDGDISRKGIQNCKNLLFLLGNEKCGQSIVFGFVQELHDEKQSEPTNPYPVPYPNFYSFEKFTYEQVWTYRRLKTQNSMFNSPTVNDKTLQNWGSGNDFPFGYIYLDFENTRTQLSNWTGGVNLTVLKFSEYHSYGFHYWYKQQNEVFKDYISMNKEEVDTCFGLSKYPYFRESRRSIGLDNFIMKMTHISGDFEKSLTGEEFFDRVALACYTVDIHSLSICEYPDYMKKFYPILPFYVPIRALTNKDVPNLVVSGKNIAQSFLVNSATRVHPGEFSVGIASGVVASYMVTNHIEDTKFLFDVVEEIQEIIKKYAPVDWTINYPPED